MHALDSFGQQFKTLNIEQKQTIDDVSAGRVNLEKIINIIMNHSRYHRYWPRQGVGSKKQLLHKVRKKKIEMKIETEIILAGIIR